MQFKVKQQDLLAAMTFVNTAIDNRSTLPILNNVLLVAEDNELTIVGTNLQIEKQSKIASYVDQAGSITVPAKRLLDFARNASPDKNISFKLKDGKIMISSERAKWNLTTLPATDFPEFKVDDHMEGISVDASELSKAIQKCQSCVDENNARKFLRGMLLSFSDGLLNVVSSDGSRLIKYETECEGVEEDTEVILPKNSAVDISKLLAVSESPEVKLGKNNMSVSSNGMSIRTNLVDLRFPDFTRLIPNNQPVSAEFNTIELSSAVKRVVPLANQYFSCRFEFFADKLTVSANNPQQDVATEDVDCRMDSEAIELGFNGNFFLDIMSCVESDNVTLQLKDNGSACRIDDGKLTAILMPVKI